MEATFCLGRHPLSTSLSSLPFTSNISNLSAINHHGRIRHSSLSLNSGYLRSSHTHMLRPVMCTFDRLPKPGSNNLSKADNKPRSMVGVAAVLACVLGIIGCSSRKYHMAMAQVFSSPPKTDTPSNEAQGNTSNGTQFNPDDPRYALNSLLKVFENSTSSQVKSDFDVSMQCQIKTGQDRTLLRNLLEQLQHISSEVGTEQDFATVKRQALFMLRYGMANEAVEMVKKKYDQAAKKEEELAYPLDMLLVEILICQGKYKEARERKCLQEEGNEVMTDSRRPLYKAIIYSMSDQDADKKKAMEFWKDFLEFNF